MKKSYLTENKLRKGSEIMVTLKARTFNIGGVHPPDNKHYTASKPIKRAPLPDTVTVPLTCMGGRSAPAKLVVRPGQEVKTGQLIADLAPKGFSAKVHSPVTGKVLMVKKAMTVIGGWTDMVVIKRTSEDVWAEGILTEPQEPPDDPKQLLEMVKDAGVVGMGGAGFPTHIKLSPPVPVDTLIINGAECEPFITADHRLMVEKPEEIVKGTLVAKRILGVDRVYIGIEENKPDAIEAISKAAEGTGIEVVPLKTKYPQGSEKHLIYAITGRMIPSGKLPMHVGVVVQNVATIYAIYEATYLRKPLIERVITITGSGINEPSNLLVRIGTSVRTLIDFCGGLREGVSKVVAGGPMMGRAMVSLDVPVGKACNGFVANIDLDWVVSRDISPCINCARCVDHCPMGLAPTWLARHIKAGIIDGMESVLDCIECGTCVYVCPANRPLLQFIRVGKAKVLAKLKK